MHQASILFTAAVMAMGGAWWAMRDMSRADVAAPAVAVEHSQASGVQIEPLAD
jgi:hypothetical protein